MSATEERLRAHTLPVALRRTYWAVQEASSLAEKHEQAFFLWQDTVLYLGALAFADYRSHRVGDPDARTEAVLRKWPRPWTNDYVELLRASLRAGPPSGLFVKSLAESVTLRQAQRLLRGVDALELAEASGAPRLAPILKLQLATTQNKSQSFPWEAMLELLGNYRNQAIGHKDRTSWRHIRDFYDCMTPLVCATAFELLAQEDIRSVIDTHPVATLTEIERLPGGRVRHVLKGEYLGTERRLTILGETSALDMFSHPLWRAEIGSTLLLEVRGAGGEERFTVRALFHDFLGSKEAPAALTVVAPSTGRISDAEDSTVTPGISAAPVPGVPRHSTSRFRGQPAAAIGRDAGWRRPLAAAVAAAGAAALVIALTSHGSPARPVLEIAPLGLRLLNTSRGPGLLLSQYARNAKSVTVNISALTTSAGQSRRQSISGLQLKHLKGNEWALLTRRRDLVSLTHGSGLAVTIRACNGTGCVAGGYGGPA